MTFLRCRFSGKKYIILTNNSWLGSSGNFMGIVALAVGGSSLVLGILYLLASSKKQKFA